MTAIIPEYRAKTSADRWGEAFANLGRAAATGIPQSVMGSQQRKSIEEMTGIGNLYDTDLQKTALASELQGRNAMMQAQQKAMAEEAGALAERESLQGSMDTMVSLLNDVGLFSGIHSVGVGKANKETREARAQFNTHAAAIEGKLVEMVNKGALSNTRFEYMKSLLPKPGDTVETNLGKLEAFYHMFGLDPTALQAFRSASKKSENPARKGKRAIGIKDTSQKPDMTRIFI